MSGYVNDSVRSLGLAVGAADILEKPLDLRKLKNIVHGEADEFIDQEASDNNFGEVIELDLFDNFLLNPRLTAVLQPIIDLQKTEAPFIPHAVESLARAHHSTPLANPELLFAYASKKERLFEADCLCIRAAFAEAAQLTSVYYLLL